MSEIPSPEFWATQNRLGELVPEIETLAASDPDHLVVGVNAKRNSILIIRRPANVPHSLLEQRYRASLPDDVALEFIDSAISDSDRHLIHSTVHNHRQRLARRSIHVTQIGARTAGGPVEILYWSPSRELTFDLLVELNVTEEWPEDLVQRRPITLYRLEGPPSIWGRRRRA